MVVTVKPDQAGEYGVVCNEFCGIGHHNMVGKIYVVE
jgi:cytochrome c oxidase subunit 2